MISQKIDENRWEKCINLESSGLMVFKNFLKVKGVSSNRVVGLGI